MVTATGLTANKLATELYIDVNKLPAEPLGYWLVIDRRRRPPITWRMRMGKNSLMHQYTSVTRHTPMMPTEINRVGQAIRADSAGT